MTALKLPHKAKITAELEEMEEIDVKTLNKQK